MKQFSYCADYILKSGKKGGKGRGSKKIYTLHGPAYRVIQLFHWRARADEHVKLCKLGTLVARKRVSSLNSVALYSIIYLREVFFIIWFTIFLLVFLCAPCVHHVCTMCAPTRAFGAHSSLPAYAIS